PPKRYPRGVGGRPAAPDGRRGRAGPSSGRVGRRAGLDRTHGRYAARVIDGLLIGAFVAYALVVAARSRREASRDLEAYFLAGRRLRAWESGLSMTATQYAADTPLLAAGLVATGGVFALWRLWTYGIAFLALGFLLGACWWRAGVVTDAELCELRYGGRPAVWLRGVKAVYYGVVFNCAVLAMVLAA